MPGSYSQLFYHFIWTTKNRAPTMTPELREALFRYIRMKCQQHRAVVYGLGGIEDHVHLLVSLPPNLSPSKFAADIKGAASHFVNDEILKSKAFYWQEGYGVVSLAKKDLKQVAEYIDNQEEHHHENRLWPSMETSGSDQVK